MKRSRFFFVIDLRNNEQALKIEVDSHTFLLFAVFLIKIILLHFSKMILQAYYNIDISPRTKWGKKTSSFTNN